MFAALALASLYAAPVGKADEPTETVVRLTVTPKGETRPALKYTLLPEFADAQGGNAVHYYYKAMSRECVGWIRNKEVIDKVEAWKAAGIDGLPVEEADKYTRGTMFRYLDAGARSESCNWQITDEIKRDGIKTLLPDVQGLREFANYLSLRTQVRLRQADFADAAKSLQTQLAMARHIADHPTLICNLIGVAIAQIAVSRVEEWVARPDAPNLYWALRNCRTRSSTRRRGCPASGRSWPSN